MARGPGLFLPELLCKATWMGDPNTWCIWGLFLNLSRRTSSLGSCSSAGLDSGPAKALFLTNCQVMLMLPVRGPHFEFASHWLGRPLRDV